MSDYTPRTEDVRGAYRAWHDGQGDDHPLKPTWSAQEFDRWLAAHDESVFRSAWLASGEGFNGEYPDEGVPWEKSVGRESFTRWMSEPHRNVGA